MIEFKKVVKKYGDRKVLNDVDLRIENGELVTVIGPSGAGKSTLIYTLMGAEKIDSGEILVDGYRIDRMGTDDLQMFRRRIGVVFQDYKLLATKTALENVAYALEVCGVGNEEVQKKSIEALERVGLADVMGNFPNQLSGGEKQRVAIARALVHEPALIIADEPTGNLDPKAAADIIKLLKQINKSGISVILTTHNREVVAILKSRVITIEGGEITKDTHLKI